MDIDRPPSRVTARPARVYHSNIPRCTMFHRLPNSTMLPAKIRRTADDARGSAAVRKNNKNTSFSSHTSRRASAACAQHQRATTITSARRLKNAPAGAAGEQRERERSPITTMPCRRIRPAVLAQSSAQHAIDVVRPSMPPAFCLQKDNHWPMSSAARSDRVHAAAAAITGAGIDLASRSKTPSVHTPQALAPIGRRTCSCRVSASGKPAAAVAAEGSATNVRGRGRGRQRCMRARTRCCRRARLHDGVKPTYCRAIIADLQIVIIIHMSPAILPELSLNTGHIIDLVHAGLVACLRNPACCLLIEPIIVLANKIDLLTDDEGMEFCPKEQR